MPIVHARSAKVAIGNGETQRVDQVEPGACNRAEPTDVASVLRDLRLKKDDVQHVGLDDWVNDRDRELHRSI